MTASGTAPSISDEAVREKTGQAWDEWFAFLDASGAQDLSHREIVALLKERTELNGWWQQMVTVTYEQARGIREMHQKEDGYQISASKTISVPVEILYRSWADTRQRARWLTEKPTIRTKTENLSLRALWTDGITRLDVMFYVKTPEKCQVTVNHSKIADAAEAEQHKQFWREALQRLKSQLES